MVPETIRAAAVLPAFRWSLVVLPLLALIAQLWPVLHELWTTSSTYSHGYLVLAIAAWLGLQAYRRGGVYLEHSWFGLAALTVMAVVALVARAADVVLVQQAVVPSLLLTGLWALGGWQVASRYLAPLSYLYFAVSAWDYLTEPLRAATTVAVGWMAQVTAIPVYLVGNSIHIPSGTFEVEGGCSGLHYLVVACALAAYIAIAQIKRLLPSLLLLVAAFGIAVLANWLRVYIIVLAGHLTEMQHYLVAVDHYYFGWALFFVLVLPLLLLFHRFGVRHTSRDFTDRIAALRRDEKAASPHPSQGAGRAYVVPFAAALLVGTVTGGWLLARVPVTATVSTEVWHLPESISQWQLRNSWDDPSRPSYFAPNREAGGRYVMGPHVVDVYIVGYDWQQQGAELIYYGNAPVPESEHIQSWHRIDLKTVTGKDLPIRVLQVEDRAGRSRLVWLSYQVAGRATSSDAAAKFYQVLGAMGGRRDASGIVLSARCQADCRRAAEALRKFGQSGALTLLHQIASKSEIKESLPVP